MTAVFKFGIIATVLLAVAGCGLAKSDEQRLREVDEYMQEGNYRTASIELKNVLNNNPDNAEARTKLSVVLLGLNDILGAEKELQRATDLGGDPVLLNRLKFDIWKARGLHLEILASIGRDDLLLPEGELLEYRGAALVAVGNAEAAQATYRDLLEMTPESEAARIGMARAIAIGGDRDLAIEQLNEIIKESPASVDAWLELGNFNYASGQYELAEEAYKKSLEVSMPQTNVRRYLFALTGLADAQLILGDTAGARLTINRVTSYAPRAEKSLLLQARLAQMEGDFFEASRALNELLVQSPDDVRVLLSLGNVQARLGNYRQAQAYFERVVSLAPNNLQARKQLANVQLRQQDTSGAIEVLTPLLDEFSDDSDLFSLMATAELQSGDTGSAIDLLLKAHEANPDDVAVTLRLADAYRRNGNADKTVELLTALPTSGGAPFTRERILMSALASLGRTDEAMKVGDELLGQQADNVAALNMVAAARLSIGEVASARQLLKSAQAIDPENHQVLLTLASLEQQDGNSVLAAEIYNRIDQSGQANLNALLGLAQISSNARDLDSSISYLERARSEFPKALAPRLVLARIYLSQGKTVSADAIGREMATIGSNNSDVLEAIGLIFLESGATEEAEAQYELAVERNPESVTALLGLARSHMMAGETDETTRLMERVLEIDPSSTTANSILALTDLGSGNLARAEQRIRVLRASNPDDIAAIAVEGELFYAQGDFANAAKAFKLAADRGAGANAVIREFQSRVALNEAGAPEQPLVRWLEQHPKDSMARTYLAEYYQLKNNSEKAIEHYEELLKDQPENVIFLNNLAWEHNQAGNTERAITLANTANTIRPNYAPVMDTLGWIYRDSGDLERSLKLIGSASRLAPENPEITYHHAVVLSESGKTSEARQVLETLLAGDEDFSSRDQALTLMDSL